MTCDELDQSSMGCQAVVDICERKKEIICETKSSLDLTNQKGFLGAQ